MHITDLITVERIRCDTAADSREQALNVLGELLATAQANLTAAMIAGSLIEREDLCGTSLGHGIAIPHGRLAHCRQATGAFLKLDQGVDFNAADHQPVDLLFAFIVPAQHIDEHLEILALLARLFSDSGQCTRLRRSTQASGVFELLTHWQMQQTASA